MERDDALLEAKLQAALKEVFGKDATFRANQLVRLDTGRCRTPRPPFLVSFLLTLRTPNTHPTPTQHPLNTHPTGNHDVACERF